MTRIKLDGEWFTPMEKEVDGIKKYRIEDEWFTEEELESIPELSQEEIQNIVGHVERYDEFKERIVNDVMGLEHNPRFKHFGNGSEIDEGGAVC